MLHLTQGSNWLEQWDLVFLRDEQDRDTSISELKILISQSRDRPKMNFPNQDTNTLLRQWDRLRVLELSI